MAGNGGGDVPPEVPERTMSDYLNPARTTPRPTIVLPATTEANTFTVKMHHINMMPSFYGKDKECPYTHMRAFEELVSTIVSTPAQLESAKLKLFPFSVKDKAKIWLNNMRPQSLANWADLSKAFYMKFFPPHLTKELMNQIQMFKQKEGESFYQYWERYKDLLNSIPYHGLPVFQRVEYLLKGCFPSTRLLMDSMCVGGVLAKTPDAAWDYFEELAEKTQNWDCNLRDSGLKSKGISDGFSPLSPKSPAPKLVVIAMVRSKHTAKGTRKAHSSDYKRPVTLRTLDPDEVAEREAQAEERSKKQKLDEAEKAKQDWINSVQKRNFICERQLKQSSFKASHRIHEVITNQGLGHFFKVLKGFRAGVVKEFYANVEVNRPNEIIKSVVGSKTVIVNPDVIAKDLNNYQRPELDKITYPKEAFKLDFDELKKTLSDNKPDAVQDKKFLCGKLNDLFRLINKVVHHNLNPHSKERALSVDDAHLIYVFSKEEEKVDWARQIFNALADFHDKGLSNANIPFPVMITRLCEQAKVKFNKGDEPNFYGCPQATTGGSEKKSKSMTKPPLAAGISRPIALKSSERNEQWWEITMCRLDAIQEEQKALKKKMENETRRRERKEGKLMRKTNYVAVWVGETSGKPYVPTQEDDEQTTDEDVESAAAAGGAGSSKKKGVAIPSQSNSDDEGGGDNENLSE
ncbi:hypothetical protein RHSIM_Rhsim08G0061100 [Rhododendron simsii]|uniref:Retrotransposon gag domain-containing protein n=1 Tax=Rhododendron simsii TaxID=118357 RepID=A0A834GKF8_RHOSS|nr:hypothetical protein RHSIM_Rhsim08G0061100 [Rhododendron simsii]